MGFIYKDYPYPNIVLWSLEVEVAFERSRALVGLAFAISELRGRFGFDFLILAWPNLVALCGLQGVASHFDPLQNDCLTFSH